MKKCLISSNCQGVPLASQLLSFPDFVVEYELEVFLNYTKAIIPDYKLAMCDLLIYQRLDNSWGNLSEDYLLNHVNSHAKIICMPNMVNFSLWPTACNSGGGSIDLWGDKFVDTLIARNLDVKEIVYLVMKADLAKLYNVDNVALESLQRERTKKYDFCSELCDFVEENYKKQQLFSTPNHPYGILLNYIAKRVLESIGYSNISMYFLPNLDCDTEFHLPIHPSIVKYFNLPFAKEEHLYPVFGRNINYREYLYDYVLAKQQKIPVGTFLKEYGQIIKK